MVAVGVWGRTLLSLGIVALGLVSLYAAALFLLSDRPEPPETRPLEVVVNHEDKPCTVSSGEVRAGQHFVSVIGESGFARVDFVDSGGEVVLTTDNKGQKVVTDEDREVTIVHGGEEGEGPLVQLEAGTYTVRCRPTAGVAGEASLRVLPARAEGDG